MGVKLYRSPVEMFVCKVILGFESKLGAKNMELSYLFGGDTKKIFLATPNLIGKWTVEYSDQYHL